MKTVLAIAVVSAALMSAPASAWESCGCAPAPKGKVNSGVGNGYERFGTSERNDADPGRSGAHNAAGKNSEKPQSAAAGTLR
jgi:hypothetical protein